ncbi:MAG: transglutaminase-like domain-containing protein [Actinomycetota bacterium]
MSAAPERLRQLLADDAGSLDRIMAVVASIAPEPPSEDEVVAGFDELAIRLGAMPNPEPKLTAAQVVTYAYGKLGFVGDTANYYDPANSFIHRVLRRRRGIPLTLAAVATEIGRRVNVELSIVGLPGHVILGDGPEPERWFDPFAAGAELDEERCRSLFARFHPIEAFDRSMLRPIDAVAIATRMLGNLKLVYRKAGDLSQMVKVLELAVALPTSGVTERYELAAVLSALGRYDQAAEQRELLVGLDPEKASEHLTAARIQRARRN